jgi:hypothetical protein
MGAKAAPLSKTASIPTNISGPSLHATATTFPCGTGPISDAIVVAQAHSWA